MITIRYQNMDTQETMEVHPETEVPSIHPALTQAPEVFRLMTLSGRAEESLYHGVHELFERFMLSDTPLQEVQLSQIVTAFYESSPRVAALQPRRGWLNEAHRAFEECEAHLKMSASKSRVRDTVDQKLKLGVISNTPIRQIGEAAWVAVAETLPQAAAPDLARYDPRLQVEGAKIAGHEIFWDSNDLLAHLGKIFYLSPLKNPADQKLLLLSLAKRYGELLEFHAAPLLKKVGRSNDPELPPSPYEIVNDIYRSNYALIPIQQETATGTTVWSQLFPQDFYRLREMAAQMGGSRQTPPSHIFEKMLESTYARLAGAGAEPDKFFLQAFLEALDQKKICPVPQDGEARASFDIDIEAFWIILQCRSDPGKNFFRELNLLCTTFTNAGMTDHLEEKLRDYTRERIETAAALTENEVVASCIRERLNGTLASFLLRLPK